MQLQAFDQYQPRVLRVLLALKLLEERKQYATYDGLAIVLGKPDQPLERTTVYQAVRLAIDLDLVQLVEASNGGRGQKSVFGLTDKGREALRG